jgi:hypothetical protein
MMTTVGQSKMAVVMMDDGYDVLRGECWDAAWLLVEHCGCVPKE